MIGGMVLAERERFQTCLIRWFARTFRSCHRADGRIDEQCRTLCNTQVPSRDSRLAPVLTLALLLIASPAYAQLQQVAFPPIVEGQQQRDRVFPCDGVEREWFHLPNRRVEILRAHIWIGTNGGAPVDVYTSVLVKHPAFAGGVMIAQLGLDHYADFSAPHQWTEVYAPDERWPAGGDGTEILVRHRCVAVDPTRPSASHTEVRVNYK